MFGILAGSKSLNIIWAHLAALGTAHPTGRQVRPDRLSPKETNEIADALLMLLPSLANTPKPDPGLKNLVKPLGCGVLDLDFARLFNFTYVVLRADEC
jgi:hypothetical protein